MKELLRFLFNQELLFFKCESIKFNESLLDEIIDLEKNISPKALYLKFRKIVANHYEQSTDITTISSIAELEHYSKKISKSLSRKGAGVLKSDIVEFLNDLETASKNKIFDTISKIPQSSIALSFKEVFGKTMSPVAINRRINRNKELIISIIEESPDNYPTLKTKVYPFTTM